MDVLVVYWIDWLEMVALNRLKVDSSVAGSVLDVINEVNITQEFFVTNSRVLPLSED